MRCTCIFAPLRWKLIDLARVKALTTSFFVGIVAAAVVDSGVNVDCGGGGGAATAVTGGLIALMVACGSGGC